MVQGGMTIIKYLTFFFNFLFVLFGLVFIIIGSLTLAKVKDLVKIADKFQAPIILIIVLGCVILLLSFFGCCGAIKENYCMLMTFSTIIFLIFVVELAAGIAAYVYRNSISEKTKEIFQDSMKSYYKDDTDKEMWDYIQTHFNCCGIDNFKDWDNYIKEKHYPSSCCSNDIHANITCTSDKADMHEEGCYDAVKDALMKYSKQIGIAALVIAFLQLLGMIFGCCLARSIKKEYETV